MTYSKKFKCVAVSENTNSFGLFQCVLITNTGGAYKACANSLNIPKRGDDVWVEYLLDKEGKFAGYNFARNGFEIPERLPDAPKEVIDEIFKPNNNDKTTTTAQKV